MNNFKSEPRGRKPHSSTLKPRRRMPLRQRAPIKYQEAKDGKIEYKNLMLLQRFLNERGKIFSRRITGVSAKDQRQVTTAIKRARFLALLPTGGVKK